MDVLLLSRLQFALNITFHYLFPPMSIGLVWYVVMTEAIYLKTRSKIHLDTVKFWTKIFSLFFVMGVATGFVQVFSFGNNWSQFSKFVGDVFGAVLAAEGIFAFFLEAGFIGFMLFGWDRISPTFHFISSFLVAIGATMSAFWIVAANSWMQTPAGFKIVGEGIYKRAVITDLFHVYFNPSFLTRFIHVMLGCALLGCFLVLSVSSYYLLRKRHLPFARFNIKLGLITAMLALMLQLWSADSTASGVVRDQPIKLAAMEGVFDTAGYTPFSVIGIIDMKSEKVVGLKIPGLLSLLSFHNLKTPVKGLKEYAKADWPTNVPGVYYCYHLMIYGWGAMMIGAIWGLIAWKRGRLESSRPMLSFLVICIFFPYLSNITGWYVTELGRQPWVVYGVLRTAQAVSRVISAGQVIGSLIMFIVIYSMLGTLFVFLLNRKIQHGPDDSVLLDDVHYRTST